MAVDRKDITAYTVLIMCGKLWLAFATVRKSSNEVTQ